MKIRVAALGLFFLPLVAFGVGDRCGGLADAPCPDGYTCTDDPSDDCDPQNGGSDCIGYCALTSGVRDLTCGGFAGTECPEGYTCVDDEGDDCDPQNGGSDCIGVCVVDPKSA